MKFLFFLTSMISSLSFNMGLIMSFTFGALMLIRPVTNRFLRPRQRVTLWYWGWYCMIAMNVYGLFSLLPLHFTFRSVLSVRTMGNSAQNFPAFIPPSYDGPGRYNLSLPGNTVVPVTITDAAVTTAVVLYLTGLAAVFLWSRRQKQHLRALEQPAQEVELAQFGLETYENFLGRAKIKIFLCDALPTSYVRMTSLWGSYNECSIYLQRDLSPERLELVLRHEIKHIQLSHIQYKWAAHIALIIFWWSPVLWLAFRIMCRDMELACDEAVMDGLDEHGRREYARTIAELGAGRPLWESAACFGECDAAARVRRAVEWEKAGREKKAISWTVFALLFVFFYCGSPAGDGTLTADRALRGERAEKWDVISIQAGLEFEGKVYSSSGSRLDLVEIWREPGTMLFYGRFITGRWVKFRAVWSDSRREYLYTARFDLSEPPDLAGLEQIIGS